MRNGVIEWKQAPDIRKRVRELARELEMKHIERSRVFCFRSHNAKTRAYARVWGLGRIWQQALSTQPAYVLEVISERFDKMNSSEQDKVLIHELLHIPKNFSGALVREGLVRGLYAKLYTSRR